MRRLVIFGPTTVGKTELSLELARQLNGEIISADSMQVYRGLDIGTAKPTVEERRVIPHHLIDVRNPDEEWTVSDFVRECTRISDDLKIRGKIPIIVGGTGLYLRSLIEGFSFPIAPADKEIRARLESLPVSALCSLLSAVDPEAAQKIHANDKKRIIRALEVYELTGKPISKLQESRKPIAESGTQEYTLVGLNVPRAELYSRINRRVDSMIEKGLIDEVRGLLAKGYSKELNAFQALGYKEVVDFLDGKYDRATMIEELKKRTRNFARRQMTWFRRFRDVSWFSPGEKDAIMKLCQGSGNKK